MRKVKANRQRCDQAGRAQQKTLIHEYADHADHTDHDDHGNHADHADHTACADHVDQAGGRRHLQSG